MEHHFFAKRKSLIPQPFLSLPKAARGPRRLFTRPQQVDTLTFYTLSDGRKRVYTSADALQGHGTEVILAPEEVSYMNLFINGILQSKQSYAVAQGKLVIRTEDIPIKGTPIILQMVTIR
ncbi:DUF4183 domain-containing protein [Sporolactobacillus inulinus]|uniref:DUF4183 domain-containing protein n=2 Tax=Sporolactobacillus inulinus TaxID=2078 RepID=A0A4Y3T9Y9_9BACL|nr:DUF4183 domain-containing protein [Sporolactobacillus inulinus]KLI03735.1 hypothetical protein SINU_01225 [Sporolactobacillus inulinus CASD]GAY75477.1 hypothetical protein NBRC111894_1031 [Sporolactobacillus inulinus]GEB77755.1 hypothetical protein SIN01_21000 [Sporolactobacillus inulinus]